MKNLFADIIIANANVDRPFTYIIPEKLRDSIIPGCPVLIEFGKIVKKGYVIDIRESTNVDISKLKSEGYKIYASCLEDAISSKSAFTDEKTALILGNESMGISEDSINQSDKKIKIDMTGNAQSLNVATAGAILIYEMCK